MANEVKLHPVTGEELVRATYPRKVEYKGLSKTIQMTGWNNQLMNILILHGFQK